MKKKLLTIALIIVILPSCIICSCANKAENSSSYVEENNYSDIALKLDEYMKSYNENCSYKYSGAVLVAKGDKILLNKGYGMANYEENIPNESDSVFAIGSISKSFTAVAIMQLQEKQLLNVDDPISKYIDGHQRGDDITIHHLLTHTSGIRRNGLMLGPLDVSLEKNIKSINKYPLIFEPGEDFLYSNAGYTILAAIIEKVSGKSYNDYIMDNIFIPLEMNTSKGGTDNSYIDNQSIGYEILTNDPKKLSLINFSCITGGGNIYSKVEDLYKYDRAFYSDKLLSQESLEKMFTPYFKESHYGYGWGIAERFGHEKYCHSGHIGGYYSSIIRYPDDDYVLIFLTNNSNYTALYEVAGTMEAIIFEKDYIIPKKINVVEVNPEILKKYAGSQYEFEGGFIIAITYKDGKLFSKQNNGNTYQLLPVSERVFYYKNHESIRAEFLMDEKSNVVGLNLFSEGSIHEGKKVNKN